MHGSVETRLKRGRISKTYCQLLQNVPIFLNRLIFGEDTDNDKVERFLDTVYTCVAGKTSIGGQTLNSLAVLKRAWFIGYVYFPTVINGVLRENSVCDK